MKNLLATTLIASIAATSAFAGSSTYWDKKISNKDMRVAEAPEDFTTTAFGFTMDTWSFNEVPGYYSWLLKKKDGVLNAGKWRMDKLDAVLNRSDEDMHNNVCHHLGTLEDLTSTSWLDQYDQDKADKYAKAQDKLGC